MFATQIDHIDMVMTGIKHHYQTRSNPQSDLAI
jgi:hypothetical protein